MLAKVDEPLYILTSSMCVCVYHSLWQWLIVRLFGFCFSHGNECISYILMMLGSLAHCILDVLFWRHIFHLWYCSPLGPCEFNLLQSNANESLSCYMRGKWCSCVIKCFPHTMLGISGWVRHSGSPLSWRKCATWPLCWCLNVHDINIFRGKNWFGLLFSEVLVHGLSLMVVGPWQGRLSWLKVYTKSRYCSPLGEEEKERGVGNEGTKEQVEPSKACL